MAVCALLLLPAVPSSGVRCGRVCWGPGFCCAPPPLGGTVVGCACGRGRAPLAPALPGGPPVARGCAGVAVGGVRRPPPLWFFFWLCGVGRWLSRSWVSWSLSPHPFSSGPRCLLFVFFLPQRGVCLRVLDVPSSSGPLPSAWCCRFWLGGPPGAPPGGHVFSAVWVGGLAASCGVRGRRGGCGPFSRPPCCFFFWGGVCLFLPLPPLGWRTHWSAFCVVFRFAVGGSVLPGCAPAPWVGRVMYTLGSALLPAGLRYGSAGTAVVPGGFVWPQVSCIPPSPRCRFYLSGGSLCGWTATVVAGRAVALCRCVACWCGSFRGVRWLDLVRPSVSVHCLVLWCVVVRRAASCRVLTCCVVLVCAVLRCALLGPAVLRRVAPWSAALYRVASHCAVACRALGCLVVLRCTVVRCGAVCGAASCCAVVGRWRLVWPLSWCGV